MVIICGLCTDTPTGVALRYIDDVKKLHRRFGVLALQFGWNTFAGRFSSDKGACQAGYTGSYQNLEICLLSIEITRMVTMVTKLSPIEVAVNR